MTVKPCCIVWALILLGMLCIVPVLADTWENNWAPWVTKTTTTDATINWRQDTNGTGTVAYATTEFYNQNHRLDSTVPDTSVTPYHHVLLEGLAPNTSYTYLVQPAGSPVIFSPRTFRTMPESGPYTFIVISDPQDGTKFTEDMRFHYVAAAIAKEPDVRFILAGGDYARLDDFGRWGSFFHNADGMLSNTTIFPTIGNHEYHNITGSSVPSPAINYHQAFAVPLNYSFDVAGVRYISLDTQDPTQPDPDPVLGPPFSDALVAGEESWLRQQLDNQLSGTFTIQHQPNWRDDYATLFPTAGPWEKLYHTYNLSASFAGHNHNYERFSIKGTPYFIVGTAGGFSMPLNATPPAGYQTGTTRRLGYLKVRVDPAGNTATAEEVTVGYVREDNDNETPVIYPAPVIDDTITFPLNARRADAEGHPAAPAMTGKGNGPTGSPAGFPPVILVAGLIVILVAVLGGVMYMRKRRSGDPPTKKP
jgi:acid phosphatase type 7